MAKGNSKINNGSKILKCGGAKCSSPTDDDRYGKDMRVHAGCAGGWRCTICTDKKGDA